MESLYKTEQETKQGEESLQPSRKSGRCPDLKSSSSDWKGKFSGITIPYNFTVQRAPSLYSLQQNNSNTLKKTSLQPAAQFTRTNIIPLFSIQIILSSSKVIYSFV